MSNFVLKFSFKYFNHLKLYISGSCGANRLKFCVLVENAALNPATISGDNPRTTNGVIQLESLWLTINNQIAANQRSPLCSVRPFPVQVWFNPNVLNPIEWIVILLGALWLFLGPGVNVCLYPFKSRNSPYRGNAARFHIGSKIRKILFIFRFSSM